MMRINMNRRKTICYVYTWNTICILKYICVIVILTALPRSVYMSVVNSRSGNERNVMLVLPVLQGSEDPSGPGLEFWYTKPPVTMVIEEDPNKKSKPQSIAHVTTTQRYSDADIISTADIITTNLPFLDYDVSETKLNTLSTTKPPHQKPLQSPIKNNSNDLPFSDGNIYVSFVKNKIKHSPTTTTTSQPNVQVISAEPKWKHDIRKLIEYDKLKAQKPKPIPEKSTVLPTSTRIQYYSDFVPIETNYKLSTPKLPHTVTFEKSTYKPSTTEFRFPTTEDESQYDFVKVYDMMKKISLKPLPLPKPGHVEQISSSDQEFFDVLREMSVPTESLFKERTKSHTSSYEVHPLSRVTDQWVFTYAPEELSTLPPDITDVSTTGKIPLTNKASQQPLKTFSSPTYRASLATPPDDKLTDDFKQMLIALGILKDNETSTTTESNELWMDPDSFTIDPLSYSKFKKIPAVDELPLIRKDMQSLLNSFGLLPKTSDKENFTSFTRVARQSKDKGSKFVLLNDGITKNPDVNVHTLFSEVNSKNISNSKNMTYSSNTSSSPSRDSNKQTNYHSKLPILAISSSTLPLTTTRKSSSPKRSKKPRLSSTTVKPKRANNDSSVSYEALADSFGGGETAKNDPEDDITTTTPNGLYFLVDWNKFLRTGDDDDKKPIRLNFSPHVGDPKLFIPIEFP